MALTLKNAKRMSEKKWEKILADKEVKNLVKHLKRDLKKSGWNKLIFVIPPKGKWG
jgi:hypothetical protein